MQVVPESPLQIDRDAYFTAITGIAKTLVYDFGVDWEALKRAVPVLAVSYRNSVDDEMLVETYEALFAFHESLKRERSRDRKLIGAAILCAILALAAVIKEIISEDSEAETDEAAELVFGPTRARSASASINQASPVQKPETSVHPSPPAPVAVPQSPTAKVAASPAPEPPPSRVENVVIERRPRADPKVEAKPAGNAKITTLTDENFNALTKRGTWIVYFWAPWHGPSVQMNSVFANAALKLGTQARFGKIDTEANRELGRRFKTETFGEIYEGQHGLPLFVVLRDGQEIGHFSGAISYPQLLTWLARFGIKHLVLEEDNGDPLNNLP